MYNVVVLSPIFLSTFTATIRVTNRVTNIVTNRVTIRLTIIVFLLVFQSLIVKGKIDFKNVFLQFFLTLKIKFFYFDGL